LKKKKDSVTLLNITYQGNFKDSEFEGFGILIQSDGLRYEGEFKKGRKNGHGLLQSIDGSTYNGNYLNDLRHGKGTYISENGKMRYEGFWDEDKYSSEGKLILSNGSEYQGSFYQGKKHGVGKFLYPDGSTYLGSWSNDKRHGNGKFTDSLGNVYDGDWKEDKMEGQGKLLNINGVIRDGFFSNDELSKNSKYTGSEKSWIVFCEGEWKNGVPHGKSTIVYKNGDSYQGGFKLNQFDGFGTYIYKAGTKVTGKWTKGIKDDIKLSYPVLETDLESSTEGNIERRYHVHIPNLPVFPKHIHQQPKKKRWLIKQTLFYYI